MTAPAEQPARPDNPAADQWARIAGRIQDRYEYVCMGVMQKIADGGTLLQVLDLVADSMNSCDMVDDESLALYERAKAKAVPGV